MTIIKVSVCAGKSRYTLYLAGTLCGYVMCVPRCGRQKSLVSREALVSVALFSSNVRLILS